MGGERYESGMILACPQVLVKIVVLFYKFDTDRIEIEKSLGY